MELLKIKKYITGKMNDIKYYSKYSVIAFLMAVCAVGLNSCAMYDAPLPEHYNQEIVIKNNLENEVVVALVPTNITPEILEREVYCTVTHIRQKEVGNCQYYVSYYGDFFSICKEMDVIVVDSELFSTYQLKDIIWSTDKQLCRCTLDKEQLLLSDAVGRIDLYENDVKLIFGY